MCCLRVMMTYCLARFPSKITCVFLIPYSGNWQLRVTCADLFSASSILQSQSAGYCEKHKYEISKEVNLLALRSSLMEHEMQRAEIARNRARNAALPINNRFPDEVLSEIFLLS